MRLSAAVRLFRELTKVPTAPFYEHAVFGRVLTWVRRTLPRSVRVRRLRGGVVLRYEGAGPGPALALAAHLDHPAFDVLSCTRRGLRLRMQGRLLCPLPPGTKVQLFPARPKDNRPLATATLRGPAGEGLYDASWTSAPARGAAFTVLDLPPFAVEGRWLLSRSIDDLLGCAVSLEVLRRAAASRLKTNVSVLLNRAEEVGFIGAMDLARSGAVPPWDSILSIETSKALPAAVPGRGPVIRTGDRASLFDPNLLALLDEAAARLKRRKTSVQRTRLTGGSCEATAYLAFGYESAGVAIPLVNYHNGGRRGPEAEKVRLSDVEGAVALLLEAARIFPAAPLRGRMRSRLEARLRALRPRL